MNARRLELTVTPELAGRTVWSLLKHELKLSGTVIRRIKWLEDGILIDGSRVNSDHRPQAGQLLSVRLSDPVVRSGVLPVPGPLDIVYEDQDLIVLNKAPGVAVHPGPGHYNDTLGNFLLDYYARQGIESDFHPVHRLDRGTSGLMVAAKHPHAQEILRQQLHFGGFRRQYLALCMGMPDPAEGVIDAPIGPVEGSLIQRQVRPDGAPARTRYRVERPAGGFTLLRLELDTGRTHQIRVHLAHIGHPLIGDFLYGQEEPELISRPALHSAELWITQPLTGEELHFSLPLPEDMRQLITENGG